MMRYQFFKTILMCPLIISIFCIENWPSPNMKETHFKSVMQGQDVTLTCAGRVKDAPAFWNYKACGIGFNRPLCSELNAEDLSGTWRTLFYNTSRLMLKKVMLSEGGLYCCKQAATPLISIYTTIQLEVVTYSPADYELPQFLDDLPQDVTVPKNSQAVFQCKVRSKTAPEIRWVWQGEGETLTGISDQRHLSQVGKWYVPRGAAGEAGEIGVGGLHSSRLVVPRVRRPHAGRYFCIALNTRGFANASAYLQVIDDESPNKWCLYVLFLLPVGLALIPLSLLFCFTLIRKRRHCSASCNEFDSVDISVRSLERENIILS
ncbi:fibroblast growth factor receptor-like 1 [Arctopsyche grandis]|uniref:fibroblast growth factor receptor-like 1 n=1 Tax=Arctopsyche grandis TaxID=121162 RepID=UPI00406D6AA2